MGLERINELRKIKGMTIEDLSRDADIPVSTLKKICAGTTVNPALETVKAIARALDCSLNEFDDKTKAPADQQRLSVEALHVAMCFDAAGDAERTLLRSVVHYIDQLKPVSAHRTEQPEQIGVLLSHLDSERQDSQTAVRESGQK